MSTNALSFGWSAVAGVVVLVGGASALIGLGALLVVWNVPRLDLVGWTLGCLVGAMLAIAGMLVFVGHLK